MSPNLEQFLTPEPAALLAEASKADLINTLVRRNLYGAAATPVGNPIGLCVDCVPKRGVATNG